MVIQWIATDPPPQGFRVARGYFTRYEAELRIQKMRTHGETSDLIVRFMATQESSDDGITYYQSARWCVLVAEDGNA